MELTEKELNHLVVIEGIVLIWNHLNGEWFLFANSIKTGNDVTLHGTLEEMKQFAKFAAQHGTITQDNYGNGSIQKLVDYAKLVGTKTNWSQ